MKHVDYLPLGNNNAAMERFGASVVRHMNDFPCDLGNASASLARLTKCISAAARDTLSVKRLKPLRKREVTQRTNFLFEERRRNNKLSEQDRRESTRPIAVSSRDVFRNYVHKVLDDIDEAESVGITCSMTKLTRILANNDRRTNRNPSLSGWEKSLCAKFQRLTTDADRNLVAEEDVLGYDELGESRMYKGSMQWQSDGV